MAQKVIIDLDPGIGDAIAAVLALLDPGLDVLALTATEGCVSPSVATRNVQTIVDQVDPPKRPRIGAALESARYLNSAMVASDWKHLSGWTGLGEAELPVAELHHRHDSPKVMIDLARQYPQEIVLVTLGPLTNIATACERAPDFLGLLNGWVCLGGSVAEGGDVTAAAEFNIFSDPEAAQVVLCGPERKVLVPLDITNRSLLTLDQYHAMTAVDTPAALFLKRIMPFYFRTHHQHLGLEGILMREAVPIMVLSEPSLFRTREFSVRVETQGGITRGMTVFDRRPFSHNDPNITVVTECDFPRLFTHVERTLQRME